MVAFFVASPLGGDVETICNFQEGKYVHMVALFGITSWGRCWENWRFSRKENTFTWWHCLASPVGNAKQRPRLLGAMLKHIFFDNMGGDLTQNDDFQSKSTTLQVCKRFSLCARSDAMLTYFTRNLWVRSWWNDRFSNIKITWPLIIFTKFLRASHAWLHNFEWGRSWWKWQF